MAITFEPGLYKVQTFTSLTDAQSDPFLFNNQYCMVGGLPYFKYNDQVHPVGTFVGTESSFPSTGNTGILYVDPVQQKLFYWTGAAYAEIFGTEQANYWQTDNTTSYSFELDDWTGSFIATATNSGSVKGFVEDELDGSTGMSDAGTYTIPSNGDYYLNGKIRIGLIQSPIPISLGTNVDIELKLQYYNISSWEDYPTAPILFSMTREFQMDFFDLEYERVLINQAAGTQYRILCTFERQGTTPIPGTSTEGILVSEDRYMTWYQLNGLFNSNLYPEVDGDNTFTGSNLFQGGLITENPDGESGALDVFEARTGVAATDISKTINIDNTTLDFTETTKHTDDAESVLQLVKTELFGSSYQNTIEIDPASSDTDGGELYDAIEDGATRKVVRSADVTTGADAHRWEAEVTATQAKMTLGKSAGTLLEMLVEDSTGTIEFDFNDDLVFKHSGVERARLNSSGDFTIIGDLVSSGDLKGEALDLRNSFGATKYLLDLSSDELTTFIDGVSVEFIDLITRKQTKFYDLIMRDCKTVYQEGGADRIELRYNPTDNRFELYNAVAGKVLQEWKDDGSIRLNGGLGIRDSAGTYGLYVQQMLDSNAGGIAVRNRLDASSGSSLRIWVDDSGVRHITGGTTDAIKINTTAGVSLPNIPTSLPSGKTAAGAVNITTDGELYIV